MLEFLKVVYVVVFREQRILCHQIYLRQPRRFERPHIQFLGEHIRLHLPQLAIVAQSDLGGFFFRRRRRSQREVRLHWFHAIGRRVTEHHRQHHFVVILIETERAEARFRNGHIHTRALQFEWQLAAFAHSRALRVHHLLQPGELGGYGFILMARLQGGKKQIGRLVGYIVDFRLRAELGPAGRLPRRRQLVTFRPIEKRHIGLNLYQARRIPVDTVRVTIGVGKPATGIDLWPEWIGRYFDALLRALRIQPRQGDFGILPCRDLERFHQCQRMHFSGRRRSKNEECSSNPNGEHKPMLACGANTSTVRVEPHLFEDGNRN